VNIIGIIGAVKSEIQLIKDIMIVEEKKQYSGLKFYICKYKDLSVILTTCGTGKVNAARCTQILIDKFNVTAIINTGVAGNLKEKVRIGDIIISNNVTYHDVMSIQMKKSFPFKESFIPDKKLINLAIQAYENNAFKYYDCHIGRVVTGDNFISDDKSKDNIINKYKPYCVEMEGAAIGHVADMNNIPFIIIKSISDNADNNAVINYEKFENIASNNSATLIINMLEILSEESYVEMERICYVKSEFS
jgi:adenosylhomocysteine nucleosidase